MGLPLFKSYMILRRLKISTTGSTNNFFDANSRTSLSEYQPMIALLYRCHFDLGRFEKPSHICIDN